MDSDGNYDSDRGTDRLAKYAEMFGLGENPVLRLTKLHRIFRTSIRYSPQSDREIITLLSAS